MSSLSTNITPQAPAAAGKIPAAKQGSCVYPHAALPLFPRLLLPAMGSRTVYVEPLGEVALANFAQSTPPDMAPELRQRCAVAIATMVQSILTRRLAESAWADLRVNIPSRVRMTDLRLTDRARVSLQAWPLFDVASPWRSASLRDLLRQQRGSRSIGARLLLGFLLAAEDAQERLCAETVRVEPQCLEDELRSLTLEAVHSERIADIFLAVRGWDGSGPKRISAVSREIGLTHERVRQIIVQAEASMRRRRGLPLRARYLQQALSLITQAAPLSSAEAAQALKDGAISRRAFDVRGLINAASYFGISCAIEADDEPVLGGVYGLGERAFVQEIRKHIKRVARSRCVVETRDIRARYSADCESSARLVNYAMLGVAGARLIGDGNWLVVGGEAADQTRARDDCRNLRICQSIARMAAYFGRITPHQVLTAMSRMRARPHDLVSRDLIVELAQYCGWSVAAPAEGEEEVIEITPEERSALRAEMEGTVEVAMARILERHDGNMALPDFSEACASAGINANTYQSYLRNSVLFGVQSQSRCALTIHEDPSDFLTDRDLLLGIAAAAAPRRTQPAQPNEAGSEPGAWS